MEKRKEEILENLRQIKEKVENDLKNNHPGYENYQVKNVTHYNKKVELINKQTNEIEEFDLSVAEIENPDTKQIMKMYYLNGEEVDFSELLLKYDSPEPIKDVVDKTEKNEKQTENEQDKELRKEELNELEKEKQQEENKKENKKINPKAEHVIQTIDVNQAYVDNWTTVSRGFKLPANVKEIAIAYPNKNDSNTLASNMTIYMLDNRGNIIQDIDVKEYFDIDDSTGNNPMYDDNTKLELDGYAEKNKSQTMKRFESKKNYNLYLSAEQKKVGEYVEVYAGSKTFDGNDPVEVQLETRNEEIQTSLEMQEIISGRKGLYNKDNIDKEADFHEKHGDDIEEISKENSDGNKNTIDVCENELSDDIIPGTKMTWKELFEITGEGEEKLKDRFQREFDKNPRESEKIVEDIEEDYEIAGHEHKH